MQNPLHIFKQFLQIPHHLEKIMADIDTLNSALDAISTELDKVSTEQQTLITELQNANQNPSVDLTSAIAKAQAIQAKLTAIDDLVPDTTPTGTDSGSTQPSA